MKNAVYLLIVVLSACGLAGCDATPRMNYDAVELVDVAGTVTLDGAPLPDAIVKFETADGRYSVGKTNEDGEYTLQFDSVMEGTTPGEKTVRISTAASLGEGMEEEAPPGEAGEESETQAPPKTERVPEKYNAKSELKVTVKPGESQNFDFELKSK